MTTCKKCGEYFSVNQYVEELKQVKRLHNRNYCLKCSPYRNTQHFSTEKETHNLFVCQKCGKEVKWKGKGKKYCDSCYVNAQRKRKKQQLIEAKGGACAICGFNKYQSALSFHHLEKDKKDFGISGKYCLSMKKLLEETEKCILLCANCHMAIHSNELKIDLTTL